MAEHEAPDPPAPTSALMGATPPPPLTSSHTKGDAVITSGETPATGVLTSAGAEMGDGTAVEANADAPGEEAGMPSGDGEAPGADVNVGAADGEALRTGTSPSGAFGPGNGLAGEQMISNLTMEDFPPDDIYGDEGDGGSSSGRSEAVSSLGMTSVVTRHRRYVMEQMHAQMMAGGAGAFDEDYHNMMRIRRMQEEMDRQRTQQQGQGEEQGRPSQFPPLEVIESDHGGVSGRSGSGSGQNPSGRSSPTPNEGYFPPGDKGCHQSGYRPLPPQSYFHPAMHGIARPNNGEAVGNPIDVDAFMSEPTFSPTNAINGGSGDVGGGAGMFASNVASNGDLGNGNGVKNDAKGQGAEKNTRSSSRRPRRHKDRCYKRTYAVAAMAIFSFTLIVVAGYLIVMTEMREGTGSGTGAGGDSDTDSFGGDGAERSPPPTASPTSVIIKDRENGQGTDDGDVDEGGNLIAVYMDRFKMDLAVRSSDLDSFQVYDVEDAVEDHLSSHLSEMMGNDFGGLELDATVLSVSWLGRHRALGQRQQRKIEVAVTPGRRGIIGRQNGRGAAALLQNGQATRATLLQQSPQMHSPTRRGLPNSFLGQSLLDWRRRRTNESNNPDRTAVIVAFFDGVVQVQFHSSPSSSTSSTSGTRLDLASLQAVLRNALNRAFSSDQSDGARALLNTFAARTVPVFALAVFDYEEEEIGSAGDFFGGSDSGEEIPELTTTTMAATESPTPQSMAEPTTGPVPRLSPEPTAEPTNQQTHRPTTAPAPDLPSTGPLADVVRSVTSSSAFEVFSLPGSPQYLSYHWLLYDDGYSKSLDPVDDVIELRERYALAVLYHSLGGPDHWIRSDNFLLDVSVCQWYGVECDDDLVEKIDWTSNRMQGTLPDEIRALTQLNELNLNTDGDLPVEQGNRLWGGLPEGLGDLTWLEELRVYRTGMGGEIPSWIGRLTRLQRLMLTENEHVGSIPESIGDLINLDFLNLSRNPINGTLPTTLGRLPRLETLRIGNTQISGGLPTELGRLSRLVTVNLQRNDLSGRIVDDLGRLSRLESLWLDENDFTGAIPSSLGNLDRLKVLFVDKNRLSGLLPSRLGLLSNLEELRLHDNDLSGTVPNGICDLFEDGLGSLDDLSADCCNGDVYCVGGEDDEGEEEVVCPCCTCCGEACFER